MAKLTLNTITSLLNHVSAMLTMNNNSTAIAAAMEKTLSRDGTSPNQMESQLDMNSNRIINLPDATNAQHPVTLGQLEDILQTSSEPISGLAAHLVDTSEAHIASAISYGGSANLSATNVEGALDELDNEKLSKISPTVVGRLFRYSDVSGGQEQSTVLFEDGTNGRVGIGTTSPQTLMHLSTSAAQSVLRIESTATDGAAAVRYKNDVQTWVVYLNSDDSFTFRDETAVTNPVIIRPGTPTNTIVTTSDGYVGIGKNNPAYALDVNGGVNVSGGIQNGGFDFIVGNADQSSRGDSGNSRALVKTAGARLVLNYSGDFTGGTSIGGPTATTNMFIEASSNGKVGIGTLTPGSRLHVNGTIQMLSSTVAGLPSASPAGQIIYVSNETGGATLAFSDGTNWRRVHDRAVCA